MDLYLVVCICIAILSIFSVGESLFKNVKMSRIFVAVFLILSVISFAFSELYVLGLNFNINFLLYLITFSILMFKLKSIKSFLVMFLLASISLALCACYNSINLLEYEFAYFQPYILLCFCLAILSCCITKDFTSTFCGLFVGISISELIRSQSMIYFSENVFIMGNMQFSSLLLFSLAFYVLMLPARDFIIKKRQKYISKKMLKQN